MATKESTGKPVSRKTRINDDLQLLKMILDENTPLRDRVIKLIERTIGVQKKDDQR
jgi:hypothetical protein